MGLRKWFGGRQSEAEDEPAYKEYSLSTMRVGFLVDYDLRTWQVTGRGSYDYDGYTTEEWELQADGQVCFLERALEDGQAYWTLTRAIGIGEIEGDIAAAIIANGDPPDAVQFAGDEYVGSASEAGLYRKEGVDAEREFVNWSFEGAEGQVLFISQWGERDFAAYAGMEVEEYQFTDILPVEEET